MASSSSGNFVPATEAVQVLVSSLADDAPRVRKASMASLKDISPLNPLLVLDSCATVSRGGRRRFGNMAGVFQVMSVAIRALDKQEADPPYMSKLAKLATAEIISSKELNADWQRAAAGVLVAIGSHLPDLLFLKYRPTVWSLLVGNIVFLAIEYFLNLELKTFQGQEAWQQKWRGKYKCLMVYQLCDLRR